uniref:Transposase n=1 Tax=Arundo donax TaxID=35708 RepID=A0A0A9CVB1_ARUDO
MLQNGELCRYKILTLFVEWSWKMVRPVWSTQFKGGRDAAHTKVEESNAALKAHLVAILAKLRSQKPNFYLD